MTSATTDDRHARAVAFERDLLRGVASHVVPLPFGEGMLAPEFHRVWDVNLVNVEHGRRPTADEVIAAAEELLGPAGFGHRTVRYEDGQAMDEVEEAFVAAGYQRNSHVVLALEGTPAPGSALPAGEGAGRPLSLDEFDRVNTRLSRDRAWGADDDQVAMFLRLARRFLEVGDGIAVGAIATDGVPVGSARVYGKGPIRQVEEVEVVGTERGRGYGRALLQAAARIAVEGDPDLVFVVAEQDDWPVRWYERLGFVRVGRSGSFHRRPPGA